MNNSYSISSPYRDIRIHKKLCLRREMPPRRRGKGRGQFQDESGDQNEDQRSFSSRGRGWRVEDEGDDLTTRVESMEIVMDRFQDESGDQNEDQRGFPSRGRGRRMEDEVDDLTTRVESMEIVMARMRGRAAIPHSHLPAGLLALMRRVVNYHSSWVGQQQVELLLHLVFGCGVKMSGWGHQVAGLGEVPMHVGVDASLSRIYRLPLCVGSLATPNLPMVIDLIGIFELKGPYCTLTMIDWFLKALSVIPRGSWGVEILVVDRIRRRSSHSTVKCQFPRGIGRSQAPRRHQGGIRIRRCANSGIRALARICQYTLLPMCPSRVCVNCREQAASAVVEVLVRYGVARGNVMSYRVFRFDASEWNLFSGREQILEIGVAGFEEPDVFSMFVDLRDCYPVVLQFFNSFG
ncbi:RNA methyltransferase [Dorcoceras hygrometricum]|uniref:RNA methyltransferase n=1 Tax=Dorcoceras hygrometricum TaxID=472368 RepID=A0A2Z7CTJ1_9LAMI|nr:RNA methyltransferase [Dorcoceras hygrometricum]